MKSKDSHILYSNGIPKNELLADQQMTVQLVGQRPSVLTLSHNLQPKWSAKIILNSNHQLHCELTTEGSLSAQKANRK
jgi:hypothetical protein